MPAAPARARKQRRLLSKTKHQFLRIGVLFYSGGPTRSFGHYMTSTPCRHFVSLQSQNSWQGLRILVDLAKLEKTKAMETLWIFHFAGPRGFEPRSTVLETGILPLNYRPLLNFVSSLYITLRFGILISSDTREVEACLHFRVSAEIKKSLISYH